MINPDDEALTSQGPLLAEVIAVGDEMTSGQRLDTNSQWLSQQLADLGIETGWHTTVGDDLERQTAVFRHAVQRAPLVIVTGGLGPTADDLTREVLANLSARPLVRDAASLRHIEAIFRNSGRPMPANNECQADFPESAKIIPNSEGTAPGIDLVVPGTGGRPSRIFCLPGVPVEMKSMWHQSVQPAILAPGKNGKKIVQRVINCFGAGESQVESMLPDMIRRGREPRIGITASMATISLRISATGKTVEACEEAIGRDEITIRESLGDLVFGIGEASLADVLVEALLRAGKTIAILDHGLKGGVATQIGLADPGGTTFRAGLVVSPSVGHEALVSPKAAQIADSAHHQVSLTARADGFRRQWKASLGIAIGPIHTGEDQREQFCLAIVGAEANQLQTHKHLGHSGFRRERSIKQVLNAVRLWLRDLPIAGEPAV